MKAKKPARVAPAVALGVASLVASLIVSELVYRAVVELRHRRQVASFAAEPWRLVPESPLIFRLRVSHAGRIPLGGSAKTVPYRTNADGFRDPARGPKRQGVPRGLVLGDSFPFGWGVRDDEPYPQRAEKLLRDQGRDVEVINAGIPGYNTEQEASLLYERTCIVSHVQYGLHLNHLIASNFIHHGGGQFWNPFGRSSAFGGVTESANRNTSTGTPTGKPGTIPGLDITCKP